MGKLIKFPLIDPQSQLEGDKDPALSTLDPRLNASQVIKLDPIRNVIPTFGTFRLYVKKGDAVAAGEVLSFLFGVTQYQGLESSRHFIAKLNQDQHALSIIDKLQMAVSESKANECLMLLASYFDLNGPSAVVVLQHLKTQDFSHQG